MAGERSEGAKSPKRENRIASEKSWEEGAMRKTRWGGDRKKKGIDTQGS